MTHEVEGLVWDFWNLDHHASQSGTCTGNLSRAKLSFGQLIIKPIQKKTSEGSFLEKSVDLSHERIAITELPLLIFRDYTDLSDMVIIACDLSQLNFFSGVMDMLSQVNFDQAMLLVY